MQIIQDSSVEQSILILKNIVESLNFSIYSKIHLFWFHAFYLASHKSLAEKSSAYKTSFSSSFIATYWSLSLYLSPADQIKKENALIFLEEKTFKSSEP